MYKLQNNIALLSLASKVLLITLLKRMREKIEYEQAGFRRGRSIADMLVAIQVIIEKTIEMGGQAFVVFIDYSKARRTYSRLCLFTNQLNCREQIGSRQFSVHCAD